VAHPRAAADAELLADACEQLYRVKMTPKLCDIVLFHRRQSGLSCNQLADICGVGKTDIYDIEKGTETIMT